MIELKRTPEDYDKLELIENTLYYYNSDNPGLIFYYYRSGRNIYHIVTSSYYIVPLVYINGRYLLTEKDALDFLKEKIPEILMEDKL